MSRVSFDFGKMVKDFLREKGLTFRAASLHSGISAAYWKDMSDGRVPTEDVLKRMSAAFDGIDEDELRAAAGYVPRAGKVDPVKAVSFALRGQSAIPQEGIDQILDFVKKVQSEYQGQE